MLMIAPHQVSLGPPSLGTQHWSHSPADGVGASPNPTLEEPADALEADHAFARLARLVASNERLLVKLRSLDAKLARANAYADGPESNILARASRDRIRDTRAGVLLLLRANRIAAREFLGF